MFQTTDDADDAEPEPSRARLTAAKGRPRVNALSRAQVRLSAQMLASVMCIAVDGCLLFECTPDNDVLGDQSINQLINQSISQSINQLINPSTNQSIKQ